MSRFGTDLGTRFGTLPGTSFPGEGGGAAPEMGVIDQIIANGDAAPGRVLCTFKRVVAAYAGPAIRLERVTGGSTIDVNFLANGDLDTATIASHCGASLGRVVTEYDQSGNARHHTQTTPAERPQIWDGAAMRVAGTQSRPAALYNRAAAQSLGVAGYLSGAGAYTGFYIGLATTTGNKVWTTHSPLRLGSFGANPAIYLGVGSQNRSFTALTPITTLGSYICTFPAGTASTAVPLEQNGTNLSQAAVTGSATVTFAATDARSGNETDGGGLGIDGVVPCIFEWGAQLSAGSLTLLRSFGAANI